MKINILNIVNKIIFCNILIYLLLLYLNLFKIKSQIKAKNIIFKTKNNISVLNINITKK